MATLHFTKGVCASWLWPYYLYQAACSCSPVNNSRVEHYIGQNISTGGRAEKAPAYAHIHTHITSGWLLPMYSNSQSRAWHTNTQSGRVGLLLLLRTYSGAVTAPELHGAAHSNVAHGQLSWRPHWALCISGHMPLHFSPLSDPAPALQHMAASSATYV